MTHLHLFLGPGGVGKSTCSASFALGLAQQGYQCAVITVDPAHRLAQVLGLQKLSNEASVVSEYENGGTLSALWLDTNDALENVIRKYSPNSELSSRVFQHRFFKLIEKQLGGIEDYLAIDKLIELKQLKKYDHIVVDTPPSQHAFDFLDSHQKLIAFFDDKILKYFLSSDTPEKKKGFFNKILHEGRNKALSLFKGTLGDGFFVELAELLSLMAPIKEHFIQVAHAFKEWLQSAECSSFVVCAPEIRPVREARRLSIELLARGISTGRTTFVLNRAIPFNDREEISELQKYLGPNRLAQVESRLKMQLNAIDLLKQAPLEKNSFQKINLFPPSKLDHEKLSEIGLHLIKVKKC